MAKEGAARTVLFLTMSAQLRVSRCALLGAVPAMASSASAKGRKRAMFGERAMGVIVFHIVLCGSKLKEG